MQAMVAINIVIGDRSYRVKIDPKDEEVVRKTVKLVNEKISEFKTQFGGKDMQDYVSMVLIWFATRQNIPSENDLGLDELESQLQAIEDTLDRALSSK